MKLISRDELRDKLDGNENFKLIMTLSARHYRAKHIPANGPQAHAVRGTP